MRRDTGAPFGLCQVVLHDEPVPALHQRVAHAAQRGAVADRTSRSRMIGDWIEDYNKNNRTQG